MRATAVVLLSTHMVLGIGEYPNVSGIGASLVLSVLYTVYVNSVEPVLYTV